MTELTESNTAMTLTFKLYGNVTEERMTSEHKIARHRLEQLSYVRPKMKEQMRGREEY